MKRIHRIAIALMSASIIVSCNSQNALGVVGGASGSPNGLNAQTSAAGGALAGTTGADNLNTVAYLKETIGDTVLFPVDQATITPQAATILDQQATLLARVSEAVMIEGHADEQGTREYNLALGARRAAAVRDYLSNKGVDRTRISVTTYGKERPLAVCSTEECWAKNRRAVTVVQ